MLQVGVACVAFQDFLPHLNSAPGGQPLEDAVPLVKTMGTSSVTEIPAERPQQTGDKSPHNPGEYSQLFQVGQQVSPSLSLSLLLSMPTKRGRILVMHYVNKFGL